MPQLFPDLENKKNENLFDFKVNDRVTRKPIQAFKYMQGITGTIINIDKWGKCKIKWDIKASTGQQHSTIDQRFLIKL